MNLANVKCLGVRKGARFLEVVQDFVLPLSAEIWKIRTGVTASGGVFHRFVLLDFCFLCFFFSCLLSLFVFVSSRGGISLPIQITKITTAMSLQHHTAK